MLAVAESQEVAGGTKAANGLERSDVCLENKT